MRIPVGLFLLAFMLSACSTLSIEEEIELGKTQLEEIHQSLDFVTNQEVLEYIDQLGQQLAETVDSSPFTFAFHVIHSDAYNAFTGPAGNIYLTTGLINSSANVAELASVISHEIGHSVKRHIAQQYNKRRLTQFGAQVAAITLAIATANPFLAGAGDLAAHTASTAYITAFSRESENEADIFAFETMVKAGFDPRSQLLVFTKLQLNAQDSTTVPFLLTHPLPDRRIEATKKRLEQWQPERVMVVNDHGRLQAIKQLLRKG